MIGKPSLFREKLDELLGEFPELFPRGIDQGYTCHDILPVSKKMPGIRLRRIKLKSNEEVYTIRPSFVLPYMTGYTDDVEKALYLRKWAVPYEALATVFGCNPKEFPHK